jgi:isopentenyl-diphosphate Delta-isomerase
MVAQAQAGRRRRVKKKAAGELPVEPAVELVDVVDRLDRVIAVMPLTEVIRQSLYYRLVSVLVFRPDGKLFLQKRGPKKNLYPNRFDLSACGHVRAGEARSEAAARELHEELGLRAQSLTVIDTVAASEQTSQAFVTLFSAGRSNEPPRPNPRRCRAACSWTWPSWPPWSGTTGTCSPRGSSPSSRKRSCFRTRADRNGPGTAKQARPRVCSQ